TRSKRDWSSDVCSSDLRAHGGVSQEPRAPEQPRVTAIDCLQLVLGDGLRVLGDYLIWCPTICRHPGQTIGIVRGKELCLFGPARSEERRVGKECGWCWA